MGKIYAENFEERIDLDHSWVESGGPFTKTATWEDEITPTAEGHRVISESVATAISIAATEKGGYHLIQTITITDVISLLSQNPSHAIVISDVIVATVAFGRTITDTITIAAFFRGLLARGGTFVEAEGSETYSTYAPGSLQSGDELQF